jgi:DNA-binding NtrC family response regulator
MLGARQVVFAASRSLEARAQARRRWREGVAMLGVLIGDGDGRARRAAAASFEEAGHSVVEAADGAYALEALRERSFDVVLCDLSLPRVDGLTVFRHVRRQSPGTAVIVTCASPTFTDAVALLKEGAADFVAKPVDVEALLRGAVGRVADRRALKTAFDEARAWLVGRIVGAALIGDSPPMRRLLAKLDGVAPSDSGVLITGESGTGKDIVARTLYARSRRAARPFVTVDCTRGAVVEDELFAPAGQLAAARDGTLFFDEVAEMPERVQARVAHALQERHSNGLSVRLLAATHHDLRARVAEGRFREDLYFLLKTVDLVVPPLRERKTDLPLLVHHFLERLTSPGLVPPGVAPRAWGALEAYDFPGNVRELGRVIEHAMVLAHGCEIEREHLPIELAGGVFDGSEEIAPLVAARRHFEREYVRRAVALCDGDVERAAGALGVAPDALRRKLGGRLSEPPPHMSDPFARRAPGPAKAIPRPADSSARPSSHPDADDELDAVPTPSVHASATAARKNGASF